MYMYTQNEVSVCDFFFQQVRPASELCRKRISVECDLDEYCNGINFTCPIDTYKPDGTSCTVTGVKLPSFTFPSVFFLIPKLRLIIVSF